MSIQQEINNIERQLSSIEQRLINVRKAAGSHNALGGLQGGQADQYYHLNAAEHGYVSGVNAQSLLTTASPIFVTAKLSNLTDGFLPYHVSDVAGLADSIVYTSGGSVFVKSPGGADHIFFLHDDTDAFIKWNDGFLSLETDEGVNTDTYVLIKGKGTGIAGQRIYDQDKAEYLEIACASGMGYVHMAGATPSKLNLQHNVPQDIKCWDNIASGNPYFYIKGWEGGVGTKWGRMRIDAAGFMHIGAQQGEIQIDQGLDIAGHLALGAAGINVDYGLNYTEVLTDTDNSIKAGIFLLLQIAKTAAAMTSIAYGIIGSCRLDSTNTQNWTQVMGIRGVEGSIQTEAGSAGTVTGAACFHSLANIVDAATITNLYGVRISTPTVAGNKVINEYGIFIADQNTGVAVNYAIYTGAGLVSLGDNLFLRVIKSGATQAAAGAAASELWKTAGHATLPNNVVMIGV